MSNEFPRLQHRLSEIEAELEAHRLVYDQLPLIVWTTDINLRFTSSAGAGAAGLPLTHDQVVGMTLWEYFRTSDPTFPPIANSLRALKGELVRYENEWLGRAFLVSVSPLRTPSGLTVGTIGVAIDVSETRRARHAFEASERRYKDLFENATDIAYTHDLTGRFTSVNRAAERLLGWSRADLLSMNFAEIISPEHRERARELVSLRLRGHGPATCELVAVTQAGERLLLDLSVTAMLDSDGVPVGIQGLGRDVTERRRLEEQVRQSQKMEAIGVLAGGIAHDFNNLLTGILGNAYLMRRRLRGEDSSEILQGIVDSAERASQLTQQLLGFARQGKHQSDIVDVHGVIRSVVALLSRTIDKRVRITTVFEPDHAAIMGDPGQIYQVFLNLALNARDAMPSGGELRFGTRRAGGELHVAVSDTGTGIPEHIRGRIFEPFFTTKGPDKGTGLGLAMVYGIVKNHGGNISFDTSTSGTTFHLSFTAAAGVPATRHREPASPGHETGRGQILVIDDEPVVRRVLTRMLEQLGYNVIGSGDSLEGIEIYRQNASTIDLVILDLVMPKLGGRECLARLRQINPDVRAVLSSGYSPDGTVQQMLEDGLVAFLQKPYTLDALSAVINRARRADGVRTGAD